jgi:predicted alpha/beta-fold hydrolase
MNYKAPAWLPGGNLQTIWPALYARKTLGPIPAYRRERWTAPDSDFIDVDWLVDGANAPDSDVRTLLVLFHGLEGSSGSHYSLAFADFAREQGLAYAVPHFRGCGGELNQGQRAYHSGVFEEIAWILQLFRRIHHGPIVVVGISLGGNALLRWTQEMGAIAGQTASAVAAVSSPIDLAAGGRAIGQGFNRMVYTRMFLKTMKPKALRKLAQHPGLFDRDTLMRARDLYEFDNAFTAPLHGYKNTEYYWSRASAKPRLRQIQIPALVVNARNDPFVPAACLPGSHEVGAHVTLWQPSHGGHVGFTQGRLPGHVRSMPDAVGRWLLQHVKSTRNNHHG